MAKVKVYQTNNSNFRVTIPIEIVRDMGLKHGDLVKFSEVKNGETIIGKHVREEK